MTMKARWTDGDGTFQQLADKVEAGLVTLTVNGQPLTIEAARERVLARQDFLIEADEGRYPPDPAEPEPPRKIYAVVRFREHIGDRQSEEHELRVHVPWTDGPGSFREAAEQELLRLEERSRFTDARFVQVARSLDIDVRAKTVRLQIPDGWRLDVRAVKRDRYATFKPDAPAECEICLRPGIGPRCEDHRVVPAGAS